MKLCVLALFAFLPWIAWVGDWALRWTEGNTALQITFVMFVFPLIMNGLQYWIIDGFIKDPVDGDANYQIANADDSDDEPDDEWLERQRRRREAGIDDDDDDVAPRKSGSHSALSVRESEYDPDTDGVGASREAGKRRTE